jgi:hypothetical protein
VNIEKFLELLAGRLDAVVPRSYRVISDRDMLWWRTSGSGKSGSYARQAYEAYLNRLDEPISYDEVISAVAFKAMEELQDSVTENSGEPWPGHRTVPAAHAVVEKGVLLMWFGDRSQPALSLSSIELADLD